MQQTVEFAVERIRPYLDSSKPTVGIILGSGLGDYAATLKEPAIIKYCDIIDHPVSQVPGHAGQYVIGKKFGKNVIAMQGRFHLYEGNSPSALAVGVRIMKRLGAVCVILTNAAGGVDMTYQPGTLMLISDHINFSGVNPLIGPNDDSFGPRFPDQSDVYTKLLRAKLKHCCQQQGIELAEGTYMMFSGPCFETPAEIRAARALGASAVGMSTVPEAITAAHCGLDVIGISLITNLAAGILNEKLTHEEVQLAADAASQTFSNVIDIAIRDVIC